MLSNKAAAEVFFSIISTQSFDNWYKSEFTDFIEGADPVRIRNEVKAEIMEWLDAEVTARARRIAAKKKKTTA